MRSPCRHWTFGRLWPCPCRSACGSSTVPGWTAGIHASPRFAPPPALDGGSGLAITSPGLWWLGSAFLVNGDEFAWALPLGVLGLPAGLALFFALAFASARLLWSDGPWRILTFAWVLAGVEWLRGHILTGFPWNVPGMALGSNIVLAQAASLVGLYGLTLIAALIFASPATLATETTPRARWAAPALGLLLLMMLAAFGAWRLAAGPSGMVAGTRLRIMQPNLAPDQKFIPANREEIVSHYLALSDKATSPERNSVADITHLFWPELAFPFILTRDPAMLARIAQMLGDKTTLITGAIRAQEPLPASSTRVSSIRSMSSEKAARSSRPTTRFISSPSASIFRCSHGSTDWACGNSCACPVDSPPVSNERPSKFRVYPGGSLDLL